MIRVPQATVCTCANMPAVDLNYELSKRILRVDASKLQTFPESHFSQSFKWHLLVALRGSAHEARSTEARYWAEENICRLLLLHVPWALLAGRPLTGRFSLFLALLLDARILFPLSLQCNLVLDLFGQILRRLEDVLAFLVCAMVPSLRLFASERSTVVRRYPIKRTTKVGPLPDQ